MNRLTDGVHLLSGFPPFVINIYWIDGYLIDSGTRYAFRRIRRGLTGMSPIGHVLTHAHPDHQGCSQRVCAHYGIPLWCGQRDADAVERPGGVLAGLPENRVNRRLAPWMVGPPCAVARRLRDGDQVGSFTVLETPGHTTGHIALWRARDRVLILGDVLASMNPFTGWPGLRLPPAIFTPDPDENRRSVRRLAALEPRLIAFGHGPPMTDTQRFVRFAESLP